MPLKFCILNPKMRHASYGCVKFEKSLKRTIMVIIFRDFLMLYQVFLSPQVKLRAIISDKHGMIC